MFKLKNSYCLTTKNSLVPIIGFSTTLELLSQLFLLLMNVSSLVVSKSMLMTRLTQIQFPSPTFVLSTLISFTMQGWVHEQEIVCHHPQYKTG